MTLPPCRPRPGDVSQPPSPPSNVQQACRENLCLEAGKAASSGRLGSPPPPSAPGGLSCPSLLAYLVLHHPPLLLYSLVAHTCLWLAP